MKFEDAYCNEYKSSEPYHCNIVFLAKFKDYGKFYQSASIRNSQFLILEKINKT